MIDLDDCDNNMTNITLATIRDANEQCNDFRNKRLDLAGELLGKELWANIHLKTLWMLIPVKLSQRKLQSNKLSSRQSKGANRRFFTQIEKSYNSTTLPTADENFVQWSSQPTVRVTI